MSARTCPRCGHEWEPARTLIPLTKRQAEIYRYLEQYMLDNGCAPSMVEIGHHFDFTSLATVHEHLQGIERKGYIRRRYNESRSIELLVRADEIGVPV